MSRPAAISTQGSQAARLGGRPLLAVEAPRQDARGGRLADAARPREDERLGDPLGRDGIAQRLRDAALADHVFEALRAPLAGQDLIGHGGDDDINRNWQMPSIRMAPKARHGPAPPKRPPSRLRRFGGREGGPTATREACGTSQGLLSAAAFRP
jgi:hypothetical protein